MSFELDAEKIINGALDKVRDIIMTRPIEAEMILKQLLRACPDHPQGLSLLGIVQQSTQEFDESIKTLERAIEIDPNNPDNYNNMALNYANLDQYEKSIEYLNKALEMKPDSHLYINNLALQFRQIGKHQVALDLFNKALQLHEAAELWCNMGGVYGEMKDMDNAERCFHNAISIKSDLAAPHVDLAFSKHLRGDWEGGFTEYEWRFKHFPQLRFYHKAYDQEKRWTGQESLEGKRILLYGEQGLGDMLQFVRYCPKLKEKGAHTIVHCADVLESVIRRCPGVDETVVADIVNLQNEATSRLPDYDYQCSLMSLPYLLKDFQISDKPYLKPLATLDFKDYKDTFNIGICWAGSPAHPNDAARSTYLKNFKIIHDLPGVKLFNLQVQSARRVYAAGKRIVDFAEGSEDMKIVDMRPMIQTFEDTATIISGMDLVLTVDTALVHLAGALGVKCCVLVPYNPDWRWKLEGRRTEWYRSVRLFRQPKLHDWKSVFEEVAAYIMALSWEYNNEDYLQAKRQELQEAEATRGD